MAETVGPVPHLSAPAALGGKAFSFVDKFGDLAWLEAQNPIGQPDCRQKGRASAGVIPDPILADLEPDRDIHGIEQDFLRRYARRLGLAPFPARAVNLRGNWQLAVHMPTVDRR